MSSSCSGSPAAHEALLVMQGSQAKVLADVSDAAHPKNLCTITGTWSPQLVTQRMISWTATQNPGAPGPSYLVTLDLFAGVTTTVASWQGGLFLDGLHSWSPDESSMTYVRSDANGLYLHLLSGGGDRQVAAYGPVPGRGLNPSEDDAYLGFSADGGYFAFVQTFAGGEPQLQVRRTRDGALVYSQAAGTMAAWSATGSKLYFREPQKTTIKVWDPAGGVTQLFALQQAWIHPAADAGDDYVAYTVRDTAGLPHVWLYGYGGRSGGELGNVRSSPVFLNAGSIFLIEEASCPTTCASGLATQPDGKTFVYSLATQAETASTIAQVLGTWPRIGQS